jgi:hypothetical protein
MNKSNALGTVVAIVGSLLAMVFAFANLGMYFFFGPQPNYVAFILLMTIAAGVGALPGLVIGWMTGGNQKPPT